jgi:tetratricopeptide (TPR) repeat protein
MIRDVAALLERAVVLKSPIPAGQLLETYSLTLMEDGRRAEAEMVLRSCAAVCLQADSPDKARRTLVRVGRESLLVGCTRPVAQALEAWQKKNGTLSASERLLLANLYYVGGTNDRAFECFRSVEAEVPRGEQHRWTLIALLTVSLRSDNLEQAKATMERLRTTYPGAQELEEADYRFAVYYYDTHNFKQARAVFLKLKETSASAEYREMATEYLQRVDEADQDKKVTPGQ